MQLVTDTPTDTPETKNAPADAAASAPAQPVDADYAAFQAWKISQAAAAEAKRVADAPAEYYVWLANGDVVRVKETDFPVSLTINGGHFEKDGNVYTVVGVYPTEDKAAK